jgi:hypothetical protein
MLFSTYALLANKPVTFPLNYNRLPAIPGLNGLIKFAAFIVLLTYSALEKQHGVRDLETVVKNSPMRKCRIARFFGLGAQRAIPPIFSGMKT